MYKVIKRDGSVAEFDIAKISGAIAKAFGALNKPCDPNDIDFIALKVTADFEDKIKDDLISVEAIQDSAEQVLIQSGHSDVAKAYILYRREREKLRNLKSTILDYKETVNNYVHEKKSPYAGKRHCLLFRWWADTLKQRRDNSQLLAFRNIRRRDIRRPPQRRNAPP